MTKKGKEMVPQSGGAGAVPPVAPPTTQFMDFGQAKYDDLLKADMSPAEKRRAYLERIGARKPRQKYASVAERKAAGKARAKARRQKKLELLPPELRPQPRLKLSPEQKKEKRKERAQRKREFMREQAQANPEIAAKYGIHVDLFKANREAKPKKEKKNKKKK